MRDFCVFFLLLVSSARLAVCLLYVSRLHLSNLLVCCEHIISDRVVEGVVLSVSLVCAIHAVGSGSF